MTAHCSILAWRMPVDRGVWRATVHEATESDSAERLRPQSGGPGPVLKAQYENGGYVRCQSAIFKILSKM